MNNLNNKIIVITGASDGIGAEAARELHAMGATVVIVGRSAEKTKKIANELNSKYFVADFAKFSEVRDLADKLNKELPRIDVLINNAGGVFGSRELTVDGHEKTMQVNHYSHFLLTNLLLDTLIKSKATVINSSSIANRLYSDFDIENIELENRYSPNKAYGNAKLANILFTRELNNRFHDKGINTAAFHPGNVATNFASGSSSWFRFIYHTPLSRFFLISVKEGIDTLIWLVTSEPNNDWKSGEYYFKRKISSANEKAYDNELSKKFWELSEKIINS